jgi:Flp pilus assembly protein TadG
MKWPSSHVKRQRTLRSTQNGPSLKHTPDGASMSQRWITKRLQREERGTAIVEFAMVAVLFFTLVFAGLDFGYAYTVRENMTHAVQEGLRDALLNASSDTGPNSRETIATRDVQARMSSFTNYQEPYGAACTPGNPDGSFKFASAGALQTCLTYHGVCFNADGTSISGSDCITLKATYDYGHNAIVGFINQYFAGTITVKATQRIS